jgi:hypothetical protein
MKTIPIKIGVSTLVGYMTDGGFPINGGNCFDLIDTDGSRHRVVNFGYENLKEWMKRTEQTDITVRCIPKSDRLWEICDDRIPKEWYTSEYCTVCTPIRLLPFEQRKQYVKNKKFTKTKDGYLIISTNIVPRARKLNLQWTCELDQTLVYAPYIPIIKNK